VFGRRRERKDANRRGGVPLSSVGRWCRSFTHGTVPTTATADTSLREAPDLPFLFFSDHQQNRRRLTPLDPPLPRRHASHSALPCDPKWVRTFELKECTCRRHHTMYILGSIGAYRSARQPWGLPSCASLSKVRDMRILGFIAVKESLLRAGRCRLSPDRRELEGDSPSNSTIPPVAHSGPPPSASTYRT